MATLCFIGVSAFQSAATIEIGDVSSDVQSVVKPLEKKDWTVCIYLCGTDLESSGSAATVDLVEMLVADIPDDVNVLVMTGGTQQWNPYEYDKAAIESGLIKEGAYVTPDSEHTQIYRIDNDKMNLVYTYSENLDMGDICTMEAFLELALYYAPAEHLMVSIWNHGGGPLVGVEYDQNTENMISVSEYTAFTEALFKARGEKTDILGFDVCLLGNFEVALNVAPYADYMIASAETEPGDGWFYEWLTVFNEAHKENRTAEAIEIGKRIIDTYPINEDDDWSKETCLTLAMYDLSKADEVRTAFGVMATELYAALDDPALYSQISRRAETVSAMCAGRNGLLDLYDFAVDMSDLLPSAKALIDVLGTIPEGESKYHGSPAGEDTFVIYRGVSPDYRECLGITFYYPTLKTSIPDEVQAGKTAITYTGLEMPESYSNFIYELLLRTDKLQHFKGEMALGYDYDREEIVVAIENPEDTIAVAYVDYTLMYTKINEDGTETSYDLGCAPVVSDWENGVFEVPFDGKWCAIEGEIFTCELDASIEYYDICYIPIMIEGNTNLSILVAIIMKDNPSVAYVSHVYDIDDSGVESRTYYIDENTKFKTLLIEKNNYGDNYAYYTYKLNEKVLSPVIEDYEGSGIIALKIEEIDLAHSTDAKYEICGRVWDMKFHLHYTDTMEIFLSNDISVFSIAPIAPQIYTGSPITPNVGLRYLDKDILLTSAFKVRYENNVEKGTGKVVVEVDDEDLKGEIVSEFLIKDVSEIYPNTTVNSWYFDNLTVMQSFSAVPKTDNLEGYITRAEFVEMLYKFYNPANVNMELMFTDVSEDSTYAPAIKWALQAGIIRGITDKTFAPDKKITRLEMIVMLERFDEERGNLLSKAEPEYHLADCDEIPAWGKSAVHWAVANGVIYGNNGKVLPDNYVKVTEAIAMISRCEKVSEE